MDPVIKQEWLRRLRSGTYKQGSGHLRGRSNTFCCLGVLCEIAVENGIVTRSEGEGSNQGVYMYGNDHSALADVLPYSVMSWAHITDAVGAFHGEEGVPSSLTQENDGGRTFSQIADLIEKFM